MGNLLWNSDLSVCDSEKKHPINIGDGIRTSGEITESGLVNCKWSQSHCIPSFSFNSHQRPKRWPLTSPFSNEGHGT